MKPSRVLGLAVTGALLCSLAQAQGLGEAAAKEKLRREQEQKKRGAAKVITTEDLVKAGSSESAPGGLAQDAQRPQDTSSSETQKTFKEGTDEVVEAPGEAQWRQRAAEAKQELKEFEARVGTLQEKADQLFGQIRASTDTNELLRLRAAQQSLTKEIEEAKIMLDTSRKELRDLGEEARRAGVPPGWVR